MSKLGFVLLTHTKPHQIRRLVERLGVLFDDPPVVCHHDFSKCELDVRQFPGNVRFVRPHHITRWGNFSLVEATFAGIRELYRSSDTPEWFALLSGADYPVASRKAVLDELNQAGMDAFLHHELIDLARVEREWHRVCLNRYLRRRFLPGRRMPLSPRFSRFFLPFSERLRCYAGSQWFTANHRCAERILVAHGGGCKRLTAHYRLVPVPDESYLHCILCNDPSLRVRNDNNRYADWSGGGSHPKTLGVPDLPRILDSGCHFARKFDLDQDSAVLDSLDRLVH
jgi:hypothetical protein